MSQTVSEMFGYERESDDDTIIDNYDDSSSRGCASRSPARPRRVKPNSGELKLYVISPGWRVELLLSFQFSIRY